MTVLVEGESSYFLGAKAEILRDDVEMAWAEKYVTHNPALKYILGKFVEADKANSNRQLFELDSLRAAQPSMIFAPMNINHSPHRIVGSFVGSELMHPKGEGASADQNPYLEALGAFWAAHFADEYALVEAAFKQDSLFYSMECVPAALRCVGESSCGQEFAYAGMASPTYCSHINERSSDRLLVNPHFTGGALIVPPVKPGWSQANITSLVAKDTDKAEGVMADVKCEMAHLGENQWTWIMGVLLQQASSSEKSELPVHLRQALVRAKMRDAKKAF